MKIKTRLSLIFTVIGTLVLLTVMAIIYFTFLDFSREDFFNRLRDRATAAANLYLEADEMSTDSLTLTREKYFQKIPDEIVRIYNARNAATFIPDSQQYWTSETLEKVRKQKYIEYTDGAMQVVGINYKDNQGDFVILASARDMGTEKRMRYLLETMAIVFITLSIAGFLSGSWLAARILSPIEEMIKRIQLIRADNLHLRVDEGKNSDELGVLARNFNSLLEHLENAFELQKTFVSSASHELRTPVTSIIGEAEVALSQVRDATEYQEVLKSILNESERLNETITALLELAEVDMDFANARLTPVRLDDLLWELQEYWNVRLGASLLSMNMNNLPADESQLIIQANKSLLYIAFNNVISNAFKFSGNRPVKLSLETAPHNINITISDEGIGIAPGEAIKIFSPFYRAQAGTGFPGHGIGLFITSKIISLYKGTITIGQNNPAGATIAVNFPS
ncbi:MAG: HAMP domain-containing protein [Chitinophagaceae bacterium]|nr:HAMP domain-containing protein [Chitinophagaceae bacterium]